jgi:hypothetical protein
MAEQPRISDATREVAGRDAGARHGAPQVPTAAEEAAAERYGTASEQTATEYEEALERGADQPGEGRLP